MTSQFVTTLDTIDCGHKIGRRTWPLRNEHAVIQRDMEVADCCEVMVFALDKDDIAKAAPSFDMFDDTNKRTGAIKALFQLFIRGVEVCVQSLRDKNTAHLATDTFPLDMFLEVVLAPLPGDAPPMAGQTDEAFDAAEKAASAHHAAKVYTKQRVTAEHLMNGARSRKGSALFGSASIDDITFMQGYDDREVVGYRFWVVSREEALRIAESVFDVLLNSVTFVTKNYGVGVEFSERNANAAPRGGGNRSRSYGPQPSLTDLARDFECYRLIRSEMHYIEMVRQYTCDPQFDDPAVIKRCLAPRKPIGNKENPVNPYNVFNVEAYFRRIRGDPRIDRRQADLRNYFDGSTLKFPRRTLVLVVPYEIWSVERLQIMYTPDHQKRTIEPSLDRGLPQAPVVAAPPPPPPAPARAVDNEDESSAALDMASNSDEDIVLSEDGPIDMPERPAAAAGFARPLSAAEQAEAEADERRANDDQDDAPLVVPGSEVARRVSRIVGINYLLIDDLIKQHKDATQLAQFDAMGGANKTALDAMRGMYLQRIKVNIDSLVVPADRAFERVSMQYRALHEYIAKCLQSASNISAPGRAINRWMNEARKSAYGLRFTDTQTPFKTRNMSLFATHILNEIDCYERLLFVHTAHSELFLARMCAMSAYWYAFGKLRLHLMLHGKQSTSKSFPIAKAAALMIEGTALALTNQSVQADAADRDDTDIVIVFEEMPVELIIKKSKAQASQDALKEMMTRGVLTRRVLTPMPDGERWQRTVSSVKQLAYLGACNLKPEMFDEAVGSRFVMRHHVQRERSDTTMQERMADEANKSHEPAIVAARMRFQHDFRFGQALHYHIEKLISIGVLHEPTGVVFSLVYPRYKQVLKDRFAIKVERRMDEQLTVFVRKLVIEHAAYWLYHSPLSPHYGAKQFSVWHLLAVEPMLKDTEEMVYFALDFFKDSFIDPNHQTLIAALRDHYVPDTMQGADQASFFVVDPPKTAEKRPPPHRGDKRVAVGAAVETIMTATDTYRDVLDSREQEALVKRFTEMPGKQTTTTPTPAVPVKAVAKHDWNYVGLRMTPKKLAEMLAQTMIKYEMPRQLGADEVLRLLMDLTRCKIVSQRYDQSKPGSTVPVVVVAGSEEQSYTPLRIAVDGRRVFVHSSLLFGVTGDPHDVALQACMFSCTPQAQFISGLPISESQPHILAVRNVAPTAQTLLVAPLTAADGSCRPAGTKVALMTTYDDYATRFRLQLLAIPITERTLSAFDTRTADAVARKQPGATHPAPIDYPLDLVRAAENARRHTRQLADQIGRVGYADAVANKRRAAGTDMAFETIDDDNLSIDECDALERMLVQERKRRRAETLAAPCNQLTVLPPPPPAAPPEPPAPAPAARPQPRSLAKIAAAITYRAPSFIFSLESNGPGVSGADIDDNLRHVVGQRLDIDDARTGYDDDDDNDDDDEAESERSMRQVLALYAD